jgi:hypothetical protein
MAKTQEKWDRDALLDVEVREIKRALRGDDTPSSLGRRSSTRSPMLD